MNINFDLYKLFYYVGEYKSITKVANNLNVSQPAVSKQIKNLENLLGIQLIQKNQKGIELTTEGKLLYENVKDSIEKLLVVEKDFSTKEMNDQHVIKIVASPSIMKMFLNKKLIEFSKNNPNIKVLINSDRHPDAIRKLRNGEVDLIFLNKKRYTKEYSELIVKDCYQTNDIFIVNSDIKNEYPSKIKLKDVNKYPILCIDVETAAKEKIEEILSKNNESFIPKQELLQENMIIEFVKEKLGIGLVTKECVAKELENNEFSIIEQDIEFPKREVCYAVRKSSIGYNYLHDFIKEIKR